MWLENWIVDSGVTNKKSTLSRYAILLNNTEEFV